MKVVLLGAGGQLATDLERALSEWEIIPLRHSDLDICDHERVRKILFDAKPEIVVNTAAFHQVDDCEVQVEKAFQVNTIAVRNLALLCADLDCTLVHISTDYVFDGEKRTPYAEDDSPNPLNVYGVSKLAGEHFVRNLCPRHFVVRSSGLYGVAGSSGKGGNFVETMIRLAREGKPIRVISDQVLSPTYTMDLARSLRRLVQTDSYGLYHITNSGNSSWYDFAAKIFELTGLEPDFRPTTSEAFGARATRPQYSVLNHRGSQPFGTNHSRVWVDALSSYLQANGLISQ